MNERSESKRKTKKKEASKKKHTRDDDDISFIASSRCNNISKNNNKLQRVLSVLVKFHVNIGFVYIQSGIGISMLYKICIGSGLDEKVMLPPFARVSFATTTSGNCNRQDDRHAMNAN